MSRSATAKTVRSTTLERDGAVDLLRQRIDWGALCEWGWHPGPEIFAPDVDDPVFGFVGCQTAGCEQIGLGRLGLCRRCAQWWRTSPPGTSFEEFCRTAPPPGRRSTPVLCLVCRTPGHERPARTKSLCQGCYSVMLYRGQSLDAYLHGDADFGPAVPRPSFGPCEATACDRWARRGSPALCEAHEGLWRDEGRPRGAAYARWCGRAKTMDTGGRQAVLRGLTERAQIELLYGLWRAGLAERRTPVEAIRDTANFLRSRETTTVVGRSVDHLRSEGRALLSFVADQVGVALATPTTEAAKDDWDLRVFGHRGRALHFGPVTQPWLKEAAKQWALERLNTVESYSTVDSDLRSLGVLSASLRRHRKDKGADPDVLSRGDMSAFCNDLSHLEAGGQLSRYMRKVHLLNVDQFFREARRMGLHAAGRPLASLPEDVTLHPVDHLRNVTSADQGRALPQVVLDQLLDPDALQLLEEIADADGRAMVELQAEVGRRTGELCALRWDCLAYEEELDEAGQLRPAPVLVHDMPKVAIRGCRLPIGQHAAEVIKAQQVRVKSLYPGTDAARLALFPALQNNPRGLKSRSIWTFCLQFRNWLAALPRLLGPGGEPYDRSEITPYSLRHCYAQRHADQGLPIDVLAALMGHKKLTTTQRYYRVTEQRKRKAVDLLAKLQVDRAGDRSRPAVARLLESEALRDAVGQVAVPFGVCREPTNIKAHGQACPFRHQCFGCTHFYSDPSFLPELRAHLNRMLADRERLRATVAELEEWARHAAVPANDEVAAVRRIIGRCEGLLGDLDHDERQEIQQAMAVLRRGRAQLDTSVPVRFLGIVGQPSPRLFPNVEQHRADDDDD